MNIYRKSSVSIAMLFLTIISFGQKEKKIVTRDSVTTTNVVTEAAHKRGGGIEWITFEEAFKLHQEEPRMWIIDVWTTWCGWCKRMDATTFSDSLVGEAVNGKYYAVSLDAEQKADIVLGDKTYKFVASGRRGYNELAAELLNGQMSYPTVVFLNKELQNLQPIGGYKSKEDFLPIVKFFYQYNPESPISWEAFMKDYVSPYKK
ncbi:MAG: DUF255 domain-containing protein [Crocinitomicaceae bacterium]|nr:DUF255 domain-containing protein [Crocinitomicaceae bacterium]